MSRTVAVGAVVGVTALALSLSACGRGAQAAGAVDGVPPQPTVLQLRCDQTKTVVVSGPAVAAQRDGLHVRTTNTSTLAGGYLNYGYVMVDGRTPGGGDPVKRGTTEQVLQVPPGEVSLNCSYDLGRTQTAAVKVNLLDVDHYFRSTTLADLGCSPNGGPSWVIGEGQGKTPDAAVEALIATWPASQHLRARLAPIGYVGAATVTYLLDRDRRPFATATVTRDHGQFNAVMDLLC